MNHETYDLLNEINKTLTRIEAVVDHIESEYVSRHEFTPVKVIVYGIASSIFVALTATLFSQFIKG